MIPDLIFEQPLKVQSTRAFFGAKNENEKNSIHLIFFLEYGRNFLSQNSATLHLEAVK